MLLISFSSKVLFVLIGAFISVTESIIPSRESERFRNCRYLCSIVIEKEIIIKHKLLSYNKINTYVNKSFLYFPKNSIMSSIHIFSTSYECPHFHFLHCSIGQKPTVDMHCHGDRIFISRTKTSAIMSGSRKFSYNRHKWIELSDIMEIS